ncbi:MAG TPA: helix-turn-helix domain-containing protein, partial [Verrucomicrobiota bacterium]|nr:helix-turn-helix domain-containing protein [Verrucomicrobiota bacterium]
MSEVGEQLRRAREAQGLSLAQVADHTKLRADHLDALERGDFGVFPAPVYVRGTVRTYARLLHLDLAPLLARLDEELSRNPDHAEALALAGRRRTPLDALTYQLSKIDWRLAAWIGGGALVLLLGVAGACTRGRGPPASCCPCRRTCRRADVRPRWCRVGRCRQLRPQVCRPILPARCRRPLNRPRAAAWASSPSAAPRTSWTP